MFSITSPRDTHHGVHVVGMSRTVKLMIRAVGPDRSTLHWLHQALRPVATLSSWPIFLYGLVLPFGEVPFFFQEKICIYNPTVPGYVLPRPFIRGRQAIFPQLWLADTACDTDAPFFILHLFLLG